MLREGARTRTALTSSEGGSMSFYSLTDRKVLGFSHHVVLRLGEERDMRRREFIILLGGAGRDERQAIIDQDDRRKIAARA
jgi:hypothetical protein